MTGVVGLRKHKSVWIYRGTYCEGAAIRSKPWRIDNRQREEGRTCQTRWYYGGEGRDNGTENDALLGQLVIQPDWSEREWKYDIKNKAE